MRTFVSKKLSGIRLIPVELEVVRETPAKRAEAVQQVGAARLSRNPEAAGIRQMDLDLVAFLELQRLRNGCRQADGQTIAPLCDAHVWLQGYTVAECISIGRPVQGRDEGAWPQLRAPSATPAGSRSPRPAVPAGSSG